MTKPSRSLSNGREMPRSESASSAANAALESGVSAASEPPVTTASTRPDSIIIFAAPMASAPPEQAETMPWHGPSSLKRMETAAAAALLIISGTESGGTFFGPPSISSSLPRSSVPMPPMPVPRMDAMRSPS